VFSEDAARQGSGNDVERRAGSIPEEELSPSSLLERVEITLRRNAQRAGSVALLVVALALGWNFVTGQNGISSWTSKRARDRQLSQEIDRLNAENARLSQHIERLKSDPAAIEFEARQRLHYARPDEVIYSLSSSGSSDATTTGNQEQTR